MALSVDDIYHLEVVARTEAEILRIRNPESDLREPSVSEVVRDDIKRARKRADDFDQIGNLLSGLQGDWAGLGPKVRAGFLRQRQAFEAERERMQAIEPEGGAE